MSEEPTNIIQQIEKDIHNIRVNLCRLGKIHGFTLEQRESFLTAEDGFRFWQRTHFAVLKKAFDL